MTVWERAQDGRCRANGGDMECSFQKPRLIPAPDGSEVVARLDAARLS